ncbi:transposase [Pseudonocardia asaccharolytica]|uniref:transposase n=1 Tax=Pseudonocardia asaccharolytica TaxID=54010 RepID=UPI003CCC4134
MPAPHPEEFRRRAVALARERTEPVAELAKELRISESCLRNWMAQADVDESDSDTKLTSKEKEGTDRAPPGEASLGDGERDSEAGSRILRPGE